MGGWRGLCPDDGSTRTRASERSAKRAQCFRRARPRPRPRMSIWLFAGRPARPPAGGRVAHLVFLVRNDASELDHFAHAGKPRAAAESDGAPEQHSMAQGAATSVSAEGILAAVNAPSITTIALGHSAAAAPAAPGRLSHSEVGAQRPCAAERQSAFRTAIQCSPVQAISRHCAVLAPTLLSTWSKVEAAYDASHSGDRHSARRPHEQ